MINMQPWQIVLIVIGSLVVFYLMFIIVDVIFVLTFKKIFIKHNRALAVCLQTKYDNVKKFLEMLTKYKIVIDAKTLERFNSIVISSFNNQESADCKKARETLAVIKDDLVFLIRENSVLTKHSDIKQLVDYIKEIDANYRTLVAMYNADVLGYNYWINFLPTRYIYKILKKKEKQLI